MMHGTGTDATLYAKSKGGEWAELGDRLPNNFLESVTDLAVLLEKMTTSLEVAAKFTIDYDKLYRSLACWVRGYPYPHGGVKMRRRKHGGRLAKLDRRQRVPPSWLVRLHHER